MPSYPRSLRNTLSPPSISGRDDRKELIELLHRSICHAITSIETHVKLSTTDDTVYTGNPGIALMYIRLWKQLGPRWEGYHFTSMAHRHMPEVRVDEPSVGHLSPLASTTGPAVIELLQQIHLQTINDVTGYTAMSQIRRAVLVAIAKDIDGREEVLYGQAGLLWAMLNLRVTRPNGIPDDVLNDDKISTIVDGIVAAGERGANKWGLEGLMWEWHGKAYLGAIHGAAGICTILLQCPKHVVDPIMPAILATTTSLCELAIKSNGHLPSSLPVKDRSDPHVQICHGSPGLILLLVTLRRLRPDDWRTFSMFADTLELAATAVWEKSVLRKGLGICHGVAGNAWALLLTGDKKWVERAIALLLEARTMPPLGDNTDFRLPDHPWSLFEGVAGVVAAWAEAAVFLEHLGDHPMLGFPGLGGVGPKGFL